MFPFPRPSRRDDGARQVLDRAVALLRQYQRHGIPSLTPADALEMLGVAPGAVAPAEKTLDPGADPLTGCRPVTPP